jgi:ketosteroid isomerase-like protein
MKLTMKKRLFFFFFLSSFGAMAQTNTDYLKDINRDIWLPFIEAYGTLDIEKYKSLQSEDFIRAEGNDKRLPTFKDYFDNAGNWFSDVKKEGRKLSIAFRFSERFANGSVASERGIYELRSYDSSGKEVWKGYGKFHVFMRKIKDVWKIVVDYDSNENNTIDEKTYQAAYAVDDFEKY